MSEGGKEGVLSCLASLGWRVQGAAGVRAGVRTNTGGILIYYRRDGSCNYLVGVET